MRPVGSIRHLAPALALGPILLALTVALGCGPSQASQRDARLAEGEARLADDPSAALQVARQALSESGPDPRLELLAAEACVKLGRRGDALTHAEQALATEDELPDELAGDLSWFKGFALVGRYRDLHVEDDWRAANTVLEQAAASGNHRAEAAFLLVALQDQGNHRDDERQLRYARLLQQLDPDGPRMKSVREALEQKGLSF